MEFYNLKCQCQQELCHYHLFARLGFVEEAILQVAKLQVRQNYKFGSFVQIGSLALKPECFDRE
jgi:hypothetical protein